MNVLDVYSQHVSQFKLSRMLNRNKAVRCRCTEAWCLSPRIKHIGATRFVGWANCSDMQVWASYCIRLCPRLRRMECTIQEQRLIS
jgi:hypothetical protein